MKSSAIRYVTFEETGEVRAVVGVCNRCRERSGRFGESQLQIDDLTLVSPAGYVHAQHYDHNDRTLCGQDATGEKWWWKL